MKQLANGKHMENNYFLRALKLEMWESTIVEGGRGVLYFAGFSTFIGFVDIE